ncbi:hypothetical protein F4820DRAFT_448634 [Hypoxylon rubiginosum]|uniref:Uncharacterized protein n=1 Tax=Hypoxylon rubiginosum TaxID=110542 RepID=A0ACB9Z078_9PEZI|nr:hypothetical protein F4820DRAFT_448634 [Hypoxylon rubiginosum]
MSDNPGPNGVPPQPEASPGGVEFMLLEAAHIPIPIDDIAFGCRVPIEHPAVISLTADIANMKTKPAAEIADDGDGGREQLARRGKSYGHPLPPIFGFTPEDRGSPPAPRHAGAQASSAKVGTLLPRLNKTSRRPATTRRPTMWHLG